MDNATLDPLTLLTHACRERRLLLLWAETPFPPLDCLKQERAFVIRQWQREAAALPPAPECLRDLPALPILSLDSTARLETALPHVAVVTDRRGVMAADRPAVLKLAGDLATRAGLWLTWDDLRAARSDPDKAHLLAEARRTVEGGILLALATHPDAAFLRLWDTLLAPLAQTAAHAFVLGPDDFPWPAPLFPLPDLTLEAVAAQLALSPPPPLTPSPPHPVPPAPLSVEIAILPRNADSYPVRITLSDGRAFNGNLATELTPWTSTGNAQSDGRRLFEALFADSELRQAWGALGGQSRIRLALDRDATELHAIPWELLHDGQMFLAAHSDWPLSRYLEDKHSWGGPVTERPVRVLAAFANPTDLSQYDLAPLDVPAERARLEAVLRPLPVQLEFLASPVTLPRLETTLRDTRPHILHLMAHGQFSRRQQQAALVLEDAQGAAQFVSEEAFGLMAERLGEQRPRLVFLAACEGAVRSTVDAFAGLAPRLIAAGVPAVAAMQDKVALSTTRTLTERFYTELFRRGEVDRALNAARSVLLAGDAADVVAPVLYSRLPDNRLLAEAARR